MVGFVGVVKKQRLNRVRASSSECVEVGNRVQKGDFRKRLIAGDGKREMRRFSGGVRPNDRED